ncbi:hypothetical protein ASF04_12305 [Duganella sp. Leaf61]|uniref:hypothetical protein n=1 Tax=Duganella sp. Leaf61 TaxID=1736227 RepID=UPI0006FE1E42|nr:hypothetical protein [Duganella sp. Leaf61]KQN70605.1 hypothetical protein ASF04_12305 [Duganella sp. Leaf61]
MTPTDASAGSAGAPPSVPGELRQQDYRHKPHEPHRTRDHDRAPDALGRLPAWLALALRVVGAIVGGYAVTALAVAACSAALAHAGMVRSEAVALCAMLGFVFYLVLALWAFSVRSVMRLWLVLSGLAVVLAALWWTVT